MLRIRSKSNKHQKKLFKFFSNYTKIISENLKLLTVNASRLVVSNIFYWNYC